MDYSYFIEKEIKTITKNRISKKMLMSYAYNFRKKRKIRYELPIVEIVDEYHLDGLLNLQIVPIGLLEQFGIEGLYSLDSNTIYISETTYNGAKLGNPKDRFTITHEFAHYLLTYVLKIETKKVNRRIYAFENPEWQANFLASELLVPTIRILDYNDGDVNYIEDAFKVSNTVARISYKKRKQYDDILNNPFSIYKKRKWINAKKNGFPDVDCVCMIKYQNENEILMTKPAKYHIKENEFIIIDDNEEADIVISVDVIKEYAFVFEEEPIK